MTPIERAARALARRACPPGGEAQFPYVSADEWEAKHWPDHVAAARAVLTAIREPSDVMVREGCLADFPGGRYGEPTFTEAQIGKDDAPVIWQAMIDAALIEE